MDSEEIAMVKRFLYGLVISVFLILFFFSFEIIQAGEVGIVTRFGAVQRVENSGLLFKIPLVEWVVKIDTKTQKHEVVASSASKDLQTITSKVAVNYHVSPSNAGILYESIGEDYVVRVVEPSIYESVKASTATFTAEELITKRPEVKELALSLLKERLSKSNVIVDDLSFVDFDFSASFNQAIEAKVTAEQNALAAQNKLEQVKFEAQQKIETAKADAESIRIQASALAQNQELVKLKAVQKWNGVLPNYMIGDSVPFLNIK